MRIKLDIEFGGRERRPGSRRRRVLAVTALAAAVAAPLAFATVRSDVFSDVPSTASDHDAINRVYQAGIMKECATSPSLQFCPNNTVLRRGVAKQYDYTFGLSGTPGNFTPTFKGANLKGAPLTTDSTALVQNLNADKLDGKDASAFLQAQSPWEGYVEVVLSSQAQKCVPVDLSSAPSFVLESVVATTYYDSSAQPYFKFYVKVGAGTGRVLNQKVPVQDSVNDPVTNARSGIVNLRLHVHGGGIASAPIGDVYYLEGCLGTSAPSNAAQGFLHFDGTVD